jgi:hypothetical protein
MTFLLIANPVRNARQSEHIGLALEEMPRSLTSVISPLSPMVRSRRGQPYNSAMTKPSKAAAIFLVLFGLVFLAFGLFMGWALLFGPPGSVHGSRTVGVVACTIFVVVVGSLAASAIYGTRKLGEQAALEQSNPDSPWLWRKDWAASRAYGNNSKKPLASPCSPACGT